MTPKPSVNRGIPNLSQVQIPDQYQESNNSVRSAADRGQRGEAAGVFTSNIAIFAIGLLAYRCFVFWSGYDKLWRYVGFVAIAWSLILLLHSPPIGVPDALFWSCAFGLLCAWQAVKPSRWLANSTMQWLGERSFSIYLLHPLTIFLLMRHHVYHWLWQSLEPTIGAWAYLLCVALTLTIVLSLSAITYALIEKPGQKLGTAIIAALRARRPSPIAQSPALQLETGG